MLEANARAISAGGWPEEAEKTAARPDGFARKLRVAWSCMLRLTFAGAVIYPFYFVLQQVLRWVTLPSGELFFIVLIGAAGLVPFAPLYFSRSDQDRWLISVVIPVGLSLVAGLVGLWILV